MTEHKPIPVSGYSPANDTQIALVNEGKQLEERVLRYLEKVGNAMNYDHGRGAENFLGDRRFLAMAKSDIQKGFMLAFRSVLNPGRIALPEDPAPNPLDIELIEADRPD